jgi:hypothetical protein
MTNYGSTNFASCCSTYFVEYPAVSYTMNSSFTASGQYYGVTNYQTAVPVSTGQPYGSEIGFQAARITKLLKKKAARKLRESLEGIIFKPLTQPLLKQKEVDLIVPGPRIVEM